MAKKLQRTELYDWHVKHGARMVPFAGWEMPVQYPTGPREEHLTTRTAAGLFDIDHMGQVTISGPEADAYLNHLVTWDVRQMQENEAHYALMCYEDGGIVDDVYLYRLPQHWFVVINAGNRRKDLAWMEAQAINFDVQITNVSDETYMLALQGPKALDILRQVSNIALSDLPRFTAARCQVDGISTLISRTGYTGEDGVEMYFPATQAVAIWETLLKAGTPLGLKPIGLAARDSLRFEPGFALYGHEIDAHITPLEARLSWVVDFKKDFVGRNALLKQKLEGTEKVLVGFEMLDRSVPRQGYPIRHEDNLIGEVATGLFAPSLGKTAGHAFVPRRLSKIGTELEIVIRDKGRPAKIARRPFYTPAYRD